MSVSKVIRGSRPFSSHDHILKLQKLTGGLVLVASHKKPSIAELEFYNQVSGKRELHDYFINCVFPPDILTQDHRYSEYSTKPGERHDITIDMEKKTEMPDGKWVKDEKVSDAEKSELIKALEKIEHVAWAGPTPHGVHCGIYFKEWTLNCYSRCILAWFDQQLKQVGRYKGSLVIDWSPSVNCNRPSRFLDKFSFFREVKPLDTAPIVEKEFKLPDLFASVTPGYGDVRERRMALRCRANMLTAEETAFEVGKSEPWVKEVWRTAGKQKAFNPFNQDVGRVIEPKTKKGRTRLERLPRKELYLNAGWAWEVCWGQGMDLPTAINHVFTSPEFEELLCLLEQAHTESIQLNQGHPKYKTFRSWVEADIARCHRQFGDGDNFVTRKTADKIKDFIIRHCAKTGKTKVHITEIGKLSGRNSKTVKKAFDKFGLTRQGKTKGMVFNVPATWLTARQPAAKTPKPPKGSAKTVLEHSSPPPTTLCTGVINPSNPMVSITKLTFEAFWKSLLPGIERGVMNPYPLEMDYDLGMIERALRPHFKNHDDWRQLTKRKENEPEHHLKDDLLDIVRRCLSWNGETFHETTMLLQVLEAIIGKQAGEYHGWLLREGYVIPVSHLVGSDRYRVAWKYNLLGEARFAWRFVEHCRRNGRIELFYGEPGTGKTEKLAERLNASGNKGVGGSAQNASAELLEKRIAALNGSQRIKTIYGGYDFDPHDLRENVDFIKRKLFFVDEFGQVSCDAAGLMAMRWKPGSTVLLALGVGQNMPVGPGRVGEDLLEWAGKNATELPGYVPQPLNENRRLDNPQVEGIVRGFQAVGRGEIPVEGPGLKIVICQDREEITEKVISLGKKLKALCVLPTRYSASEVSEGIADAENYIVEQDFSDLNYKQGEKLIIDNPCTKAMKHGWTNGTEVEVVQYTSRSYNADATILVFGPGNASAVELNQREVSRKHARTGHAIQGMERPIVVVGILPSRPADRRWLYTAISRSQEECYIVCTEAGLKECVKKDPKRSTLLPTLLDRALAAFKAVPEPEPMVRKRARKQNMQEK